MHLMHWIVYQISKIPDLELIKYQSLGEQGVEGVIQCHNSFLRQWQRNSVLLNVGIHYIVSYSPERNPGQRIHLYLCISSADDTIEKSADALIAASQLGNYYSFNKCTQIPEELLRTYSSMAILKKQEQKRSSDLSALFTVQGWKSNEDARLYEMFKVMMALNQPITYCISLFGNNIYEKASRALEKPISMLRTRTFGTGGNGQISLTNERRSAPRDFAAEDTLKIYEDFLKDIIKSPCFSANIRILADEKSIAHFVLDAACGESIEEGDCEITSGSNKTFSPLLTTNTIEEYNKMMPPMLSFWPTLFTLEEISPFFRFPILYDGENIEIQKETYPALSSNGLYIGKTNQGYSTFVPPQLLKKHAFICGVPGSGKTNTMLNFADALWHNTVLRNGKI